MNAKIQEPKSMGEYLLLSDEDKMSLNRYAERRELEAEIAMLREAILETHTWLVAEIAEMELTPETYTDADKLGLPYALDVVKDIMKKSDISAEAALKDNNHG